MSSEQATSDRTQSTLPAVIMRGGTSKGVFFLARDLPPPGSLRDQVLLEIMGSPDPMQIDGLGGTYSSTSKVMVVASGTEPGIDVSYWFAQIGVDRAVVDWSGNCGNLTTAVAPFAIDEGIVAAVQPLTTVRMRNENTGVIVIATVPVRGGVACFDGDFQVAGVPNPGARITTDYLEPARSRLGRGGALPTGAFTDEVATPDGNITVSLVNVTHPYAFVHAEDIHIDLSKVVTRDLNTDHRLLSRLERLRGGCAVLVGAAVRWDQAYDQAPSTPRLILVSEARLESGSLDLDCDLTAIGVSMGRVHHALPMTGALCLGAATAMPGTIPARVRTRTGRSSVVRIKHPKGVVFVRADVAAEDGTVHVRSVGLVSTARRLMTGKVHLRTSLGARENSRSSIGGA